MKKILIILCLIFMTACSQKTMEIEAVTDFSQAEIGRYGAAEPITRAEVAKMLSLAKYTLAEIDNMERTLKFSDTGIDKWCDKYINSAVNAGLISGTQENTFLPDYYLSLEQTQFILNNFTDTLKLSYEQEDRKKPVAYSMWVDAFEAAIENEGKSNIVEENFVILADGKDVPELGERFVMTTKGLKSLEGMDITNLKYKEIKVLSKDNEVLAIKEILNNNPVITVLVKQIQENSVLCNSCGCNVTFSFDDFQAQEGDKLDVEIEGLKILNIAKNYNQEGKNE